MSLQRDYSHVKTYNGKEPYIFISYAHRDSDIVVPVVEALQQRGYRVWFDLGIEAGTEWSNNIAAHLKECAAFIFFATENSANSENCLDEVAYAKSNQKPSLMVFLDENVELPHGTEMQTARFQRMYMNRHKTIETLVDKICDAAILDPCRGEEAPKAAVAHKENPVPQAKKQGKNWLLLGVCALAVIVAIVLTIILLPKGDGATQSGESNGANSLTMSDKLTDFTFTLEGDVYQLPCAVSDFTDRGWTIAVSLTDMDKTLDPMQENVVSLARDGKMVSLLQFNLTDAAMTVKDCPVSGLESAVKYNSELTFAKGVALGASEQEIIEKLGEPDSRNDDGSCVELVYGKSELSMYVFTCYEGELLEDSSVLIVKVPSGSVLDMDLYNGL